MKQPIIRLHQTVYDKLDSLAHEYRQATGENISYSKLIDKLMQSVDALEIKTIIIKTTNEVEHVG